MKRTDIALFTGTIVIALLIAEGVLRLFIPVPVPVDDQLADGLTRPDPVLGFTLTPEHSSRTSNGYFDEVINIDRHGLRDISDPKIPWGYLAIGDSQTFGHGVADTATWPEQLQQRLNTNVINAGVYGWGLPEYEQWLQRLEGKHPYHTLLIGLSFNDLFSARANAPLPGQAPAASESSLTDQIRRQTEGISRSTALGILARSAWRGTMSHLGIEAQDDSRGHLLRHIDGAAIILTRMQEYLAKRGRRLVVVYLSNPNHVRPDIWESERRRYRYTANEPAQLLRQALPSEVALIDTRPALVRHYEANGRKETSIILIADGHYNASGHGVIATTIADALKRDQDTTHPAR